ncbi:PPE family protein [Mycobacterium sp.]|uniref:PPE family protein n=1 Tax=unclassified Mycobacterium TaxID=2642494 RepID=UPI0031E42F09
MDYGALPPEINSARMYAGPGAQPMLAAAAAWDRLAAELRSTAASYSAVISGLTGAWLGPAAQRMAAAAAPYAAWLNTTAVRAEQTANLARTAAAAYENAFAATVPPPVVAANRAQLASLVSTNVFGQNTAAIAANEAWYAGMWARDAAAMYGYAGQSAAASALTPFHPAAQNTNPAGAAGQAGAVTQMVGNSTAMSAQSVLAHVTSAATGALRVLAAPAGADPSGSLSGLTNLLNALNSSTLAKIFGNVELLPKAVLPANDVLISTIEGLVIGGRTLGDMTVAVKASAGSAVSELTAGLSSTGSATMSAGVGQAGLIGNLSVPPSWAAATPAIRTAAAVLSINAAGSIPAGAVSQGTLFGGMAAAGMVGGAFGTAVPRMAAGSVARGTDAVVKKRKELKNGDSQRDLKKIVAAMSDKPENVQHWHTDSENLDSLLAELQKKPGIHAVHVSKKGKLDMASAPIRST